MKGSTPARLLDTRPGGVTFDGQAAGVGPLGAASVLNVSVLGRGGVPNSGVGAVVVNVTVVSPSANSYVTVYPTGASRPNASNLNFTTGQTIANMVIVPVGSNGRISLYNNAGQTHLLVDVLRLVRERCRLRRLRLGALARHACRWRDRGWAVRRSRPSRSRLGAQPDGGRPRWCSWLGCRCRRHQRDRDATVCCLVRQRVSRRYRRDRTASNLNFGAGQTVANMVIVPVGSNGKISLYNNAGQTDLVVDVLGWFAGTPMSGSSPVSIASLADARRRFGAMATECTALTNQERAAVGVAPLTINIKLNNAAEGHSKYQADNKLMTHDGANGANAGDRITAAGYAWRAWGENVAFGQADCEAVIAAWMNSPGHRTEHAEPDIHQHRNGHGDRCRTAPSTGRWTWRRRAS